MAIMALNCLQDLDVFDVSKKGIARRKRLTPDRSWGYWHADGAGVPGAKHSKPDAAAALPRALSLD